MSLYVVVTMIGLTRPRRSVGYERYVSVAAYAATHCGTRLT
jgi:hypothetical protein